MDITRLLLVLTFSLTTAGFAAEYHVTQNGSGTRDGKSEANAWSASQFNTSTNWSAAAHTDRISPGDKVYFHGEITTGLVISGSGTNGNIITLDFANGSMASASTSQMELRGNDYLTITNVTFSSNITSGYLINLGSTCTYVTVSNCTYQGPPLSEVIAVYHQYGSHTLIENNTFVNIAMGVRGDSINNHHITIRNNTMLGSTGKTTMQDIVMMGDAYDMVIEGNYLAIRKSPHVANVDDYHTDVIQTYIKGGGSAGSPRDWTIRYNLLEMNTDNPNHRSWIMLSGNDGYFKVYGNVFLGTKGGESANGVCAYRAATDNFRMYFYNNTVVVKSGPGGNSLRIGGPGIHYIRNNIGYTTNSAILNTSGDVQMANNIWCTSSSCPQNPGFVDYANNDFSLIASSPAVDKGTDLGTEYATRLGPGATFPNPALISSQGSAVDIGAYEYSEQSIRDLRFGSDNYPFPSPLLPNPVRISELAGKDHIQVYSLDGKPVNLAESVTTGVYLLKRGRDNVILKAIVTGK